MGGIPRLQLFLGVLLCVLARYTAGGLKMKSSVVFSFSEVLDRKPTFDELTQILSQVSLRHAVDALSRLNLFVRYSMQEHGRPNFGKVQEVVAAGYIDDDLLNALKSRFPTEKCEDRPLFLPQNILPILRSAILHSDEKREVDAGQDEAVRYAVGRACLMMNDLLFTQFEHQALFQGTDKEKTRELISQTIGGFELTNTPRPDHLLPRLQIMYRLLLRDRNVCARIAQECRGFNFLYEFHAQVGIPLERWLFIVYAVYAYFIQGASPLQPRPEYLLINPAIFRGQSGIGAEEFEIALASMSTEIPELQRALESEMGTDTRHDFVTFRSKPLLKLSDAAFLPIDLAFILEKSHTGVHWAIHDRVSRQVRDDLFKAWGILFEEYVHWLLTDMRTGLSLTYVPRPKWNRGKSESFDGLLIQGAVAAPIECKGGFVARKARYSASATLLFEEIDKKFATGCNQLADKIGMLFGSDTKCSKSLAGVSVHHIRAVVPILLLQDHILRHPFLNWYFNERFQERLSQHTLRSETVVRPLTSIGIHDLESIVHSVESSDFDFIYAIHNRTMRDPEVKSDLGDYLRSFPNYGRSPSPRLLSILEQVQSDWRSYLFPNVGNSWGV